MALNGLLLITTNLKQSFERLGPIVRIILALTAQKHVGLQIGYGTNDVLGLLRKSRFRCSKAAQSSTTKRRYDRGTSGLRTILRCTHWNITESEKTPEYEHNNNNNNNIIIIIIINYNWVVNRWQWLLYVYKTWNWLLLDLNREGYMRSM